MNEEKIQAIVKKFEDDYKPELGFIARSFVMASLPYRAIKGNLYERYNGNFKLSIASTYKIPFGSIPRLLLCFLSTEAVKKQSKEILLGNSLADFMRNLGFSSFSGGSHGNISRLKDAMRSLFSSMITVTWENTDEMFSKNMMLVAQTSINYRYWNVKTIEQRNLWESHIELTEEFYKEIVEKPIPFDVSTLGMLRTSPLALDIYLWTTFRNSYIRNKTFIPWQNLFHQFGSSSPNTERGRRNFQVSFERALERVAQVYPSAKKLKVTLEGLEFFPGRPDVHKLK